jgi:hypothetical protein
MEEQSVPEDMQEQIHAELGKNERLVWCERPRVEILMHHARKFQIVGSLIGFGMAAGLPVVAWVLYNQPNMPLIGPIIFLFFAVIGVAVGVYALFAPGIQQKNNPRRGCFVLTNRRLLIHPGKGTQMFSGRGGGTAVVVGTGRLGVISYTGLELTRLSRSEIKRFEGAGDLNFGRTWFDEPSGGGLWALGDVREAERLIRERLVHPVIDKLLRGETLTRDDKKSPDKPQQGPGEKEEADVIPHDNNIKDYVGGSRAPAVDPNIKDAPGRTRPTRYATGYDPKKLPAEQRELVEAELTAGEHILWVGAPEGSVQGRGVLGKIFGSAIRVEPDYTLFALTNRRALLWAKPGWRSAKRVSRRFGGGKMGPHSYYPTDLRGVGLEDDNRIPIGGDLVFRRVKLTIISQQVDKGRTKTTRTVQMYHFGFLRVRHYKAVAQLLYDTLIGPCRGLD